ncbi:MAG TPA: helix-turn-helix transcriptional regulator [Candidatus Egerieicola faecale]|uniref:Helix-turn-helix transcriptional regulator n=1 Tax=Candidatus Egerieicola faecale TaxID=2840774 RepID=A0A9D1IS43_9FIRM|nr:helix-turn-helix transcriptional regulator [Candidatus Egerieicola faecale]
MNNKNDIKIIGDNIKRIRKEKGLTQEKLAIEIGIKRETISRYESGGIQLSMEMAIKIANALGCSVGDFYPMDSPERELGPIYQNSYNILENFRPPEQNKQERLTAAFNRLNDKGQEVAVDRVEELGQIPAYQKNLQKPTDTPSDE